MAKAVEETTTLRACIDPLVSLAAGCMDKLVIYFTPLFQLLWELYLEDDDSHAFYTSRQSLAAARLLDSCNGYFENVGTEVDVSLLDIRKPTYELIMRIAFNRNADGEYFEQFFVEGDCNDETEIKALYKRYEALKE